MVQYNIGDTILQLTSTGTTRKVFVQEKENPVKNGKPGFVGVCLDVTEPYGVWGYDDQVIGVVSRAPRAKRNPRLRRFKAVHPAWR